MTEKESKRERDGGGGSMSLSTIKTVNKSCRPLPKLSLHGPRPLSWKRERGLSVAVHYQNRNQELLTVALSLDGPWPVS